MVNSNIIAIFFVIKVLRLIFTYASLLISKNWTSQIYMDKVLVNGENPPKLTNMIYLHVFIEFVFLAILLALLYLAHSQGYLELITKNENLFTEFVLPDYIISVIFIIMHSSIIAKKMYDKKYFLYKDDGLRAIRALGEMIFSISMVISVIPWNYVLFGLLDVVQEIMNELDKQRQA